MVGNSELSIILNLEGRGLSILLRKNDKVCCVTVQRFNLQCQVLHTEMDSNKLLPDLILISVW